MTLTAEQTQLDGFADRHQRFAEFDPDARDGKFFEFTEGVIASNKVFRVLEEIYTRLEAAIAANNTPQIAAYTYMHIHMENERQKVHDHLTNLFSRRLGEMYFRNRMHRLTLGSAAHDTRFISEVHGNPLLSSPATSTLHVDPVDSLNQAPAPRLRQLPHGIALIMCDVDRFKGVNDAHGHLAGDAVLQEVARRLNRGAKRDDDVLFRYGGEEFGLYLGRETNKEASVAFAESLRQAIEESRIAINADQSIPVTASFGVDYMPLEQAMERLANPDDLFKEMVGRADQALYEAKEGGRNKVVAWEEGMTS